MKAIPTNNLIRFANVGNAPEVLFFFVCFVKCFSENFESVNGCHPLLTGALAISGY